MWFPEHLRAHSLVSTVLRLGQGTLTANQFKRTLQVLQPRSLEEAPDAGEWLHFFIQNHHCTTSGLRQCCIEWPLLRIFPNLLGHIVLVQRKEAYPVDQSLLLRGQLIVVRICPQIKSRDSACEVVPPKNGRQSSEQRGRMGSPVLKRMKFRVLRQLSAAHHVHGLRTCLASTLESPQRCPRHKDWCLACTSCDWRWHGHSLRWRIHIAQRAIQFWRTRLQDIEAGPMPFHARSAGLLLTQRRCAAKCLDSDWLLVPAFESSNFYTVHLSTDSGASTCIKRPGNACNVMLHGYQHVQTFQTPIHVFMLCVAVDSCWFRNGSWKTIAEQKQPLNKI